MDKHPEEMRSVRFGHFEANFTTGELHKHGLRLKLQEQPFQVLKMLLARAGQLVTREEIRQRLWPSGTFVDFDNGLNAAVNRLREALGDSAEHPKFIETLPRHGYRFIGDLDGAAARDVPAPAEVQKSVAASDIRKLWKVAVPAAVVLATLAAAGYFYFHRAPKLTDKDTIVLADFTNTTGDPVFDGTLRQGLAVQLEQSPFLSLVSDGQIQQTLRLMKQPPDAKLTPEIAREICQRIGSTTVLDGSIAQIGTQYSLILKAVNCADEQSLASTQAQASDKNHVLESLGKASSDIREKLGETHATIQKYDSQLEQATTSSLEALQAYRLGRKMHMKDDFSSAVSLYQRAVRLDPNFAMAYASIGACYGDILESSLAAENVKRAYELRERVSERERLPIEARYYDIVTGNLEKARTVYELWAQTYPRDSYPLINLAVNIYWFVGQPEKALEQARRAQRLQVSGMSYATLAHSYLLTNQLEEAQATTREAQSKNFDSQSLQDDLYILAFLQNDEAGMAQLVSAAVDKPGAKDLLLAAQADTEGWYGKLRNARELTRQAMDSAAHNDAKESAAVYQAEATLREVESGYRQQARGEANAAVKLAPGRDVRAVAALALARAGDTTGAEKLAAELDEAFPLDTLVQRYWLPTIRAAVALERQEPSRAIELLEAARTLELSEPTWLQMSLCPVYLRGEAYLMLHDGNRAEMEFHKFIDHRGLVVNFPWGALARLGLARALALESDRAKARAAYQDFLTLWKDAEPDIPILKQAKAEYAALQ